jgi:hypothetical protein
MPKRLRVTLALAAALSVVVCLVFTHVYRPWQRTWGATDEEVRRAMAGDDLVRDPTFSATRAVTIEASPEEIWPWLVQMGYGRAGFYSWDALDNAGVPSAERIVPEYQNLREGDLLPMSPDSYAMVAALEPGRYLLLVFEGGRSTWAWELYPVDASSTRLVTRLRVREPNLVSRLLLDAFEIVMTRRCLRGIERRAESAACSLGRE